MGVGYLAWHTNDLAQGIETTARGLGYNIIFCSTHSDLLMEKQDNDMARSKGGEGNFSSAHMDTPNVIGLDVLSKSRTWETRAFGAMMGIKQSKKGGIEDVY